MSTMTKSGCGCSGSGGMGLGRSVSSMATGSRCSCGAADCAECQDQNVRRPIFFAGQLLTEDDLGALTDYVAEKNRLHNRALFGQGVVCGLEVTCDPCGGGKVTVQPGYALDCCGNDIVISCPKELDINSMIRDLRTALRGGFDCGDPCPPPSGTKANSSAANRQADAGARMTMSAPTGTIESTKRRYCLFVRYCEEPTDLISPFVTDESCTGQSCVPTRMREGWRFELRCDEKHTAPVDMFSQAVKCIGDLVSAEKSARDALVMTRSAALIEGASPNIKSLVGKLKSAEFTEKVAEAVKEIQGLTGTASAPGKPASDWTRSDVEKLLDNAGKLGQLFAARALLTDRAHEFAREKLSGRDEIRRLLRVAENMFKSLPNPAELLGSSLDVAEAETVLRVAAMASNAEPASLDTTSTGYHTFQLMAEGVAVDAVLQRSYVSALADLRGALLKNVDVVPSGDCRIQRDLLAIDLPSSTSDLTKEDSAAYVGVVHNLVGILLRRLLDCLCGALNPPCAPCDDPGVLLACIDVENCEVREICNTARTFVLSSTAIRYWAPPLAWLGEVLEAACCGGVEQLLGGSGVRAIRPLAMTGAGLEGVSVGGTTIADLRRIGDVAETVFKVAMLRAGTPPESDYVQKSGRPFELLRSTLASTTDARVGEAMRRAAAGAGPGPDGTSAGDLAAKLADTEAANRDLAKQLADLRRRVRNLEKPNA